MNLEENIKRILEVMSPAPTPFLTVFPTATTLLPTKVNSQDNTNIVYLSKRDENGRVVPNTKFSYKLTGSYSFVDFDIILKNVYRKSDGSLEAYVKPKNKTMLKIMEKMLPDDVEIDDGFLGVMIDAKGLNNALVQLHNNKGLKAEVDMGYGLKIKIEKL
jgi:hypothetical protein